MGAVVEQIQQTYDLQVNGYYSRLHMLEDFLTQEGVRSIELDRNKKFFEAWQRESESTLIFLQENGKAITTDGTNGSLSQKMKELIGDNSVSNNKKGNGTDQELFDTAKKILLSAGFSLNDIQNGKNYDANSAYTEPATSWDMNRITTLLNGKKIKLTNPSEVKNSSSNSK